MIRLLRLFSLGAMVLAWLSPADVANAQRSSWNSPAANASQGQAENNSSIFGNLFGGDGDKEEMPTAAHNSFAPPTGQPEGVTNPEFGLQDGKPMDSELAMARLCERKGDPNKAIILFKKYLEKEENKKNPMPYHRLGVLYAAQGKYEEAHHYFGQSFRLNPRNVQLLSDIGYAYYLQHKLKDAEVSLRRADSYESNNESVCVNLGLTLGMQGKFDEAMKCFRRVCTPGQSYANLAYIYSQMNRFSDARKAYLKALTLDKDLKVAAEAMLQVDELEKKHEQLTAQNNAKTASTSGAHSPKQSPASSMPSSENVMVQRSDELLDVSEVRSPATSSRNSTYSGSAVGEYRRPTTIASQPTRTAQVQSPSFNAPDISSNNTQHESDGLTDYQRAVLADRNAASSQSATPTRASQNEEAISRPLSADGLGDIASENTQAPAAGGNNRDMPAAFDVAPRSLVGSVPVFANSKPTAMGDATHNLTMPGKLPDVDNAPVPVANEALFQPPRKPPITISADPLSRQPSSPSVAETNTAAPRRPTQVIVSDIDEPVYSAPYQQTPHQATDPRFHRSYYR